MKIIRRGILIQLNLDGTRSLWADRWLLCVNFFEFVIAYQLLVLLIGKIMRRYRWAWVVLVVHQKRLHIGGCPNGFCGPGDSHRCSRLGLLGRFFWCQLRVGIVSADDRSEIVDVDDFICPLFIAFLLPSFENSNPFSDIFLLWFIEYFDFWPLNIYSLMWNTNLAILFQLHGCTSNVLIILLVFVAKIEIEVEIQV